MENKSSSGRLLSLDALRGFDMFWIMGGSQIVVALAAMVGGCGVLDWAATNMEHEAWHGFRFMDMIFPLFLFIAGISFPFSHAKRVAAGEGKSRSVYRHIIQRGLILIVLGCIYNGLLQLDFSTIRYASVLGRIGMAWMLAALIYINTGPIFRSIWTVGILVGYWIIVGAIPAPDAAAGVDVYSMEGTIVGYVDRLLLPGHLYLGIFDPEGIMGIIPAVATALMGMFAGDLVRSDKYTLRNKLILMLNYGFAWLCIGIVWDYLFPINKNLWSSSFVCYVAGISMLLFTLFYWIIDVKKWQSWTLFFRVIGMNSIAIYMAQAIVDFSYTNKFLFGGFVGLFPPSAANFVLSIGYVAVCWLLLWFMYRYKIFVKV